MSKNRISYKGKTVYVGIDVHKKTYTFSAICEGVLCKTATCPADKTKFVRDLQKWFHGAQIFTAYEAGFSGLILHRQLTKMGIKNIVINPASLEVATKDRVKTDKKDSKKIAVQLSTGRLKSIYIPSVEEENERLLTRSREQIMKDRTRAANQIKSRLLYLGLMDYKEERVVSEKFLKEYESLKLPEGQRYALELLFDKWRYFNKKIEDIRYEMKAQSFTDSYREAIYQSIPGVGEVTARTFANELGDLSRRFKNIRSLYQFVGLTPTEYSSGENQRLGHIDRQGPARIRKLLVQCAWKAVGSDPSLEETFNRIAHRRGKKRAIVAIARKLIGRMRACFLYKEEYVLGLVA